jgi:hypothetical protein
MASERRRPDVERAREALRQHDHRVAEDEELAEDEAREDERGADDGGDGDEA